MTEKMLLVVLTILPVLCLPDVNVGCVVRSAKDELRRPVVP